MLLKEAATKIKCEKTEAISTYPFITEITDITTTKTNSELSIGGIVQVVGARLKFDTEDEAQGLFFVPEKVLR